MKGQTKPGALLATEKALTTDYMQVMRDIKEFLIQKRVGNVQVNMFKGGISNWSINETKKGQ